jgi:hypothetical protein
VLSFLFGLLGLLVLLRGSIEPPGGGLGTSMRRSTT